MKDDLPPPAPPGALRLHLNENTGGCSPRVLDRMARLGATDLAFYPDYADVLARASEYYGVPPDHVQLVNGLDEGILFACVASLKRVEGDDPGPAEAVIVEPAFDMFAARASGVGGRIVQVPPRPGFDFPLRETLDAIGDRTRIVFLTSPNNPTGQVIPIGQSLEIVAAVPPSATVFLDEAYAEFGGESFVGLVDRHPNVVVGRTFAKAFGLAGVRIGAVIGRPDALVAIRRVAPPFNVNACAVAALMAALDDLDHMRRYVAESAESRELIYHASKRLGFGWWPSAGNFVLVRIGERASDIVSRLAGRGVLVRDRSNLPGCAGCVRIAAGLVEHTRACLAAIEAVW